MSEKTDMALDTKGAVVARRLSICQSASCVKVTKHKDLRTTSEYSPVETYSPVVLVRDTAAAGCVLLVTQSCFYCS